MRSRAVRRVDLAQDGQLPRTFAGRLAVVPWHDAAFLDVGLLDGLGQAVVVEQLGVAVLAQAADSRETRRPG